MAVDSPLSATARAAEQRLNLAMGELYDLAGDQAAAVACAAASQLLALLADLSAGEPDRGRRSAMLAHLDRLRLEAEDLSEDLRQHLSFRR